MKHNEQSQQTKQALSEALKAMMKKKPLNKITVRELVEDCGVNRKTFYYHFEDIFSLLKWTLDQEAMCMSRVEIQPCFGQKPAQNGHNIKQPVLTKYAPMDYNSNIDRTKPRKCPENGG